MLGLVALLGLGAWGIWGRRPPPPPPQPAPTAATPARMEALSLTEILEGDKRWVLEANQADFHKDQGTISIREVRVEFFGEPGEHFMVKAREGIFYTKSRELTLKGQVELQRRDLMVKTESVTYHPTGRVLEALEEVVLSEPRLRVQGKGLRVDLAGKKLVMDQHRLTEINTHAWEQGQ